MVTTEIDRVSHDILKDMNPNLYECIKMLVESGYTPKQLASQARRRADAGSVLPSLIESTAVVLRDKDGR